MASNAFPWTAGARWGTTINNTIRAEPPEPLKPKSCRYKWWTWWDDTAYHWPQTGRWQRQCLGSFALESDTHAHSRLLHWGGHWISAACGINIDWFMIWMLAVSRLHKFRLWFYRPEARLGNVKDTWLNWSLSWQRAPEKNGDLSCTQSESVRYFFQQQLGVETWESSKFFSLTNSFEVFAMWISEKDASPTLIFFRSFRP